MRGLLMRESYIDSCRKLIRDRFVIVVFFPYLFVIHQLRDCVAYRTIGINICRFVIIIITIDPSPLRFIV